MMGSYRIAYEKWIKSEKLTPNEAEELLELEETEIENRFFAPLEFGTAGLRGTMGLGLRKMNIHTVRHATHAFAGVILSEGKAAAERGIIICYDCRNNSPDFAKEAACVMAANGIHVRLFESLRPTPELSFAIRYYGAIAGINITASHNPKDYNGYKVYWSDGAQLPPDHAAAVSAAMEETDLFDIVSMEYEKAVEMGLIQLIGEETDLAYLEQVMAQSVNSDTVRAVADSFKLVYTPFHGAGHKLVPEALSRLGVKHILPVPEQMVIDGNFPTLESPNPENPEGFAMGIALAKQEGADLIIATDPDADRVGCMARTPDGGFSLISGNQMGVLLLDYLITAQKAKNTLPENAAAIKTIVTTEMAKEVCRQNGVFMTDTFTGFKFMAEKIKAYEENKTHEVIFSYEESYGYLIGTFLRDKDAVTASMLIAEMAAWYKSHGMTLFDAMNALYERYGHYAEETFNLVMPGLDGLLKMAALMDRLRTSPPDTIGGFSVRRVRDYLNGTVRDMETGTVSQMTLHGSNVLYFELDGDISFIVRPSGTEPKVKVYLLTKGQNQTACREKICKCSEFAAGLPGCV